MFSFEAFKALMQTKGFWGDATAITTLERELNIKLVLTNIAKGVDGLLHISELDWKRVEKVEEYLKEGDKLDVKLIGVDSRSGKIKLSKKALLPKPENN